MIQKKLVIVLIISTIICQAQDYYKLKYIQSDTLGNDPIYKFYVGGDSPLDSASIYKLPPNIKIESAIDSLVSILSEYEYFKKYDIYFEKVRIDTILLPNYLMRVGTFNMVDTSKIALHHHFQGTHGGAATYLIIACTLMQPQLEDPLMQGIIVLYNGKLIDQIDHINLKRLISSIDCDPAATYAIQSKDPKYRGKF